MRSLIDTKPTSGIIADIKPKANAFLDIKPQVGKISQPTQSRSVILGVGQYIGLPYLLTYRDEQTVIVWEG